MYRGSNNKFSDDLEPEYVTLNADQTKAFVGIQVTTLQLFVSVCLLVRLSGCLPDCHLSV